MRARTSPSNNAAARVKRFVSGWGGGGEGRPINAYKEFAVPFLRSFLSFPLFPLFIALRIILSGGKKRQPDANKKKRI